LARANGFEIQYLLVRPLRRVEPNGDSGARNLAHSIDWIDQLALDHQLVLDHSRFGQLSRSGYAPFGLDRVSSWSAL